MAARSSLETFIQAYAKDCANENRLQEDIVRHLRSISSNYETRSEEEEDREMLEMTLRAFLSCNLLRACTEMPESAVYEWTPDSLLMALGTTKNCGQFSTRQRLLYVFHRLVRSRKPLWQSLSVVDLLLMTVLFPDTSLIPSEVQIAEDTLLAAISSKNRGADIDKLLSLWNTISANPGMERRMKQQCFIHFLVASFAFPSNIVEKQNISRIRILAGFSMKQFVTIHELEVLLFDCLAVSEDKAKRNRQHQLLGGLLNTKLSLNAMKEILSTVSISVQLRDQDRHGQQNIRNEAVEVTVLRIALGVVRRGDVLNRDERGKLLHELNISCISSEVRCRQELLVQFLSTANAQIRLTFSVIVEVLLVSVMMRSRPDVAEWCRIADELIGMLKLKKGPVSNDSPVVSLTAAATLQKLEKRIVDMVIEAKFHCCFSSEDHGKNIFYLLLATLTFAEEDRLDKLLRRYQAIPISRDQTAANEISLSVKNILSFVRNRQRCSVEVDRLICRLLSVTSDGAVRARQYHCLDALIRTVRSTEPLNLGGFRRRWQFLQDADESVQDVDRVLRSLRAMVTGESLPVSAVTESQQQLTPDSGRNKLLEMAPRRRWCTVNVWLMAEAAKDPDTVRPVDLLHSPVVGNDSSRWSHLEDEKLAELLSSGGNGQKGRQAAVRQWMVNLLVASLAFLDSDEERWRRSDLLTLCRGDVSPSSGTTTAATAVSPTTTKQTETWLVSKFLPFARERRHCSDQLDFFLCNMLAITKRKGVRSRQYELVDALIPTVISLDDSVAMFERWKLKLCRFMGANQNDEQRCETEAVELESFDDMLLRWALTYGESTLPTAKCRFELALANTRNADERIFRRQQRFLNLCVAALPIIGRRRRACALSMLLVTVAISKLVVTDEVRKLWEDVLVNMDTLLRSLTLKRANVKQWSTGEAVILAQVLASSSFKDEVKQRQDLILRMLLATLALPRPAERERLDAFVGHLSGRLLMQSALPSLKRTSETEEYGWDYTVCNLLAISRDPVVRDRQHQIINELSESSKPLQAVAVRAMRRVVTKTPPSQSFEGALLHWIQGTVKKSLTEEETMERRTALIDEVIAVDPQVDRQVVDQLLQECASSTTYFRPRHVAVGTLLAMVRAPADKITDLSQRSMQLLSSTATYDEAELLAVEEEILEQLRSTKNRRQGLLFLLLATFAVGADPVERTRRDEFLSKCARSEPPFTMPRRPLIMVHPSPSPAATDATKIKLPKISSKKWLVESFLPFVRDRNDCSNDLDHFLCNVLAICQRQQVRKRQYTLIEALRLTISSSEQASNVYTVLCDILRRRRLPATEQSPGDSPWKPLLDATMAGGAAASEAVKAMLAKKIKTQKLDEVKRVINGVSQECLVAIAVVSAFEEESSIKNVLDELINLFERMQKKEPREADQLSIWRVVISLFEGHIGDSVRRQTLLGYLLLGTVLFVDEPAEQRRLDAFFSRLKVELPNRGDSQPLASAESGRIAPLTVGTTAASAVEATSSSTPSTQAEAANAYAERDVLLCGLLSVAKGAAQRRHQHNLVRLLTKHRKLSSSSDAHGLVKLVGEVYARINGAGQHDEWSLLRLALLGCENGSSASPDAADSHQEGLLRVLLSADSSADREETIRNISQFVDELSGIVDVSRNTPIQVQQEELVVAFLRSLRWPTAVVRWRLQCLLQMLLLTTVPLHAEKLCENAKSLLSVLDGSHLLTSDASLVWNTAITRLMKVEDDICRQLTKDKTIDDEARPKLLVMLIFATLTFSDDQRDVKQALDDACSSRRLSKMKEGDTDKTPKKKRRKKRHDEDFKKLISLAKKLPTRPSALNQPISRFADVFTNPTQMSNEIEASFIF